MTGGECLKKRNRDYVPYSEYQYTTTAFVKKDENGNIEVDFTHITEGRHIAYQATVNMLALSPVLCEDTPFARTLKAKIRRFQTPEEMIQAVNEYFVSCFGPALDKYGRIIYDKNGQMVRTQITPYTVVGLCNALGLVKSNLRHYRSQAEAGKLEPGYGNVVNAAFAIVEEYAERRIYEKDASLGAKFILQSGFHWNTDKEEAEIRNIDKKTKLLQDEFDLKKKLLDGTDGDSEITVNIVRKTKD